MAKIILIAIAVTCGWYIYSHNDFIQAKDKAIQLLLKEKTINLMNTSRSNTQKSVEDAVNNY